MATWAERSSASGSSSSPQEAAEEVGEVGSSAQGEGNTKWLVPASELDEEAVRRNFDPDVLGASVVPSPMRGIRFVRLLG